MDAARSRTSPALVPALYCTRMKLQQNGAKGSMFWRGTFAQSPSYEAITPTPRKNRGRMEAGHELQDDRERLGPRRKIHPSRCSEPDSRPAERLCRTSTSWEPTDQDFQNGPEDGQWKSTNNNGPKGRKASLQRATGQGDAGIVVQPEQLDSRIEQGSVHPFPAKCHHWR